MEKSFFKTLTLSHARAHPWQYILVLLAVVVGVSGFCGVMTLNKGVLDHFRQSVYALTSKESLPIWSESKKLPSSLYGQLKAVPGVRSVIPVREITAIMPDTFEPVIVKSLDIFEAGYSWQPRPGDAKTFSTATQLLTHPHSVAVSPNLAKRLGTQRTLSLIYSGQRQDFSVSDLSLPFYDPGFVVYQDIAHSPSLWQDPLSVTRYEVTVAPEQTALAVKKIQALLPSGTHVGHLEKRYEQGRRMISGFEVNLMSLAMVSFLVGFFIIYLSFSLGLRQRQSQMALLLSLGAGRRQLMKYLILEAVALGLMAGVVGLFLGTLAARLMMASFSQAVSELYFPVHLSWQGDPWVIFSSLILGAAATVLAALDPILALSRIHPVQFLRESAEEGDFTVRRRKLFILGFVLCGLSGVTQMATSFTRPYFSFVTCLFFTLGWVFMAPAFLGFLSRLFDRALPSTSLLKLNEVQKYLFRYAQVAASLIVAFSLTFAIIDMTQSFRHTIVHWLGHQFQADIFMAPADRRLNPYTSFLDDNLVERITKSPEILYYYGFKNTLIPFRGGDISVYVADTKNYFRDKKINRRRISIKKSRIMEDDKTGRALKKSIPVFVSENFSLRHGCKLGDEFTMIFPGEHTVTFIVDAAFDDYTSEQGMIVVDKKFTQDFFPMDRFNAVHIFLKNPERTQDFIRFSQGEIGNHAVNAMSNGELRDVVLKIFDQTFFLAGSLKWLCFLVAFLGLLINLALLVEVRRKSLSLLRSHGMSRWQMMTIFFTEGTVVVTFVFLWAILESLGLLWILIYGVQKYYFSWIIEFHYTPQNWFWAFIFVLWVMLVMTGILFYREFRKPIVEAIRYE